MHGCSYDCSECDAYSCAISCAIGGERISKHNHVMDAIFKAAVEAGLGPIREPDGLFPGSDDRPADVLIPIWTEGRDTALDVTVVNPLQQALVVRTSEEGDSAVAHAHKEKLRKYEARCSAEAISFLPLAVDTFGGWHKVGLKTITRLGRQLVRNLGKDGRGRGGASPSPETGRPHRQGQRGNDGKPTPNLRPP